MCCKSWLTWGVFCSISTDNFWTYHKHSTVNSSSPGRVKESGTVNTKVFCDCTWEGLRIPSNWITKHYTFPNWKGETKAHEKRILKMLSAIPDFLLPLRKGNLKHVHFNHISSTTNSVISPVVAEWIDLNLVICSTANPCFKHSLPKLIWFPQ